MHLSFADILKHAGGFGAISFNTVVVLAVVGSSLVATGFYALQWWVRRRRGRDWPAVSAVVNIVGVTYVSESDDGLLPKMNPSVGTEYYLAALTYTYRNPEEQMGDYSRRFGDKAEAEAWANSYNGETVKVRVDPRDPARSVLRDEDL